MTVDMISREDVEDRPKGLKSEIFLRTVSAVVLASLALLLTYFSVWSFAVMLAAGVGVVCWEWSRIVRGKEWDLLFFIHLSGVVLAVAACVAGYYTTAVYALIGAAVGAYVLADDGHTSHWMSVGIFYIGLPVIGLIWLRQDGGEGWFVILFVYLIVWATDTGAYLAGRAFGGPKLAPKISPNKTWAGFVGGAVFSIAVGALFAFGFGETSPIMLGFLGFYLCIVAQVGDLFESLLKRKFGIKDSSHIIPGHGGLLDRVDGFLFAAIAAALLSLLLKFMEPTQTLLIWR